MDSENPIALAIAVLRERVRRLPEDDQNDLYALLPALLGGDDKERESAQRAVREILDQAGGTIRAMNLCEEPDDALRGWIGFISERIREARSEAGMTQDELAEKSGIPQSHISRLESGKHSPTAKTLEKIAEALGISMGRFDPSA
ncbi:MAG: helix-turn-helix transcriptional regulator [Planctomycetaceae bacterium]